jgi:acyl carrier protein
MAASIEERVIATIARSQKLAPEQVQLDSTFEQLGIDSLAGIELMFELEDEFSVDIPDTEARRMTSVQDAINGMRGLLEQGQAQA